MADPLLRIIFRILLFSFLSASSFALETEPSVKILCYHTFLGRTQFSYDFTPDEFRLQMETLHNSGYRFISGEELMNRQIEGSRNILITIDDGNHSVKKIEPVLDALQIKPVLFIYPAVISRKKYALSWGDLRRMKRKGYTIGAHGYYHLHLIETLYDTRPEVFQNEIVKPFSILEQMMFEKPRFFAYPYGAYSGITRQTLQAAGYRYGFALTDKPFDLPETDVYAIPRYLMTRASWKKLIRHLTGTDLIHHKTLSSKKPSAGGPAGKTILIPPRQPDFD
jgi:peptidoglycan/xylan/chitin deacetylase (PgdA/CDA1 family)